MFVHLPQFKLTERDLACLANNMPGEHQFCFRSNPLAIFTLVTNTLIG